MSLRDSLVGPVNKSSSTEPERHHTEPTSTSDSEDIQEIHSSDLIEQHEGQFGSISSGPDLSPTPSATRLTASVDDTLPHSEHPKKQVTGEPIDLAEP